MTTDPNRPSDPMDPAPSTPPPSTPPPSTPPPSTPPPSTPPPVGAGDPLGAAPGTSPGYTAAPTGATGFPPPAPPPAGDYAAPPPETSGYGTTPLARTAGSGFNLAKVSTYDRGIAAAAVLFLIALLLPWASVSIEGTDLTPGLGGSESESGISSGLLVLGWILLLAAAVVALLPAFAANVKLPFPRPLAVLGLTGLAAVITLLGFFDAVTAPSEIAELEELGVGVDYSAGIGAYLGLLVAIAAVVLAFLAFRTPRSESIPA